MAQFADCGAGAAAVERPDPTPLKAQRATPSRRVVVEGSVFQHFQMT